MAKFLPIFDYSSVQGGRDSPSAPSPSNSADMDQSLDPRVPTVRAPLNVCSRSEREGGEVRTAGAAGLAADEEGPAGGVGKERSSEKKESSSGGANVKRSGILKKGKKAGEAKQQKARRDAKEYLAAVRAYKRAVFDVQMIFLESTANRSQLEAARKLLTQSEYRDVVTERVIAGSCGNALCGKELQVQKRKGRYRISLSEKQIYDLEETGKFCSNECMNISDDYALSLPLNREAVIEGAELARIVEAVKSSSETATGATQQKEISANLAAAFAASVAITERDTIGAVYENSLDSEPIPSSSSSSPPPPPSTPSTSMLRSEASYAVEGYVPQRLHGAARLWMGANLQREAEKEEGGVDEEEGEEEEEGAKQGGVKEREGEAAVSDVNNGSNGDLNGVKEKNNSLGREYSFAEQLVDAKVFRNLPDDESNVAAKGGAEGKTIVLTGQDDSEGADSSESLVRHETLESWKVPDLNPGCAASEIGEKKELEKVENLGDLDRGRSLKPASHLSYRGSSLPSSFLSHNRPPLSPQRSPDGSPNTTSPNRSPKVLSPTRSPPDSQKSLGRRKSTAGRAFSPPNGPVSTAFWNALLNDVPIDAQGNPKNAKSLHNPKSLGKGREGEEYNFGIVRPGGREGEEGGGEGRGVLGIDEVWLKLQSEKVQEVKEGSGKGQVREKEREAVTLLYKSRSLQPMGSLKSAMRGSEPGRLTRRVSWKDEEGGALAEYAELAPIRRAHSSIDFGEREERSETERMGEGVGQGGEGEERMGEEETDLDESWREEGRGDEISSTAGELKLSEIVAFQPTEGMGRVEVRIEMAKAARAAAKVMAEARKRTKPRREEAETQPSPPEPSVEDKDDDLLTQAWREADLARSDSLTDVPSGDIVKVNLVSMTSDSSIRAVDLEEEQSDLRGDDSGGAASPVREEAASDRETENGDANGNGNGSGVPCVAATEEEVELHASPWHDSPPKGFSVGLPRSLSPSSPSRKCHTCTEGILGALPNATTTHFIELRCPIIRLVFLLSHPSPRTDSLSLCRSLSSLSSSWKPTSLSHPTLPLLLPLHRNHCSLPFPPFHPLPSPLPFISFPALSSASQPPLFLGVQISPFGMMWMAFEEWVSAETVAFIYGRDRSSSSGSLQVNGRDYPPKVAVPNGLNLQFSRTFSENVGRALPDLAQAIRLSVPLSTVQSVLGQLVRTFTFREALPPFSSSQWRVATLLLVEAVGTTHLPVVNAQLAARAGLHLQVAAAAGMPEEHYKTLRALILPQSA